MGKPLDTGEVAAPRPKINSHSMESDRISTTADFADLQQHCRFLFSVVLFSRTQTETMGGSRQPAIVIVG
jgi:hypothetical protein